MKKEMNGSTIMNRAKWVTARKEYNLAPGKDSRGNISAL
jgi:hypothetical protein